MKSIYLGILCFTLFVGCQMGSADKKRINSRIQGEENPVAEQMFQGIWFLSETDTPFLKVDRDSLRFFDQPSVPVLYSIIQDSLYTFGADGADAYGYKIDRQSDYSFWFHSLSNRVVKLYKSENDEDSLYFTAQNMVSDVLEQSQDSIVLQKDSIIFYNDVRYHGYSFINPSSFKVYKPMYSDEGIRIDEIYNDNVIYICVYEGKDKLFGQNVYKDNFKDILEDNFFSSVILADMDFTGVTDCCYYFQAKVEVPNSLVYELINIAVDKKTNKLSYYLQDNKS